jgi:UDP:flavonoid glycosyltransferase YjiC (YdhE family)
MRITIAALGTRGDVQPMIALGKGLRAKGHNVTLIAGENFGDWVRSHGLGFVGTADMEEVMRSPGGMEWVQSSENPRAQLGVMKRLLRQYGAGLVEPIIEQAQYTDVYLSVFVSAPFIQCICEKYPIKQVNLPLQPYLPTRSGPASLIAAFPRGDSIINYWLGLFGERALWSVSSETVAYLRQRLDLPPYSTGAYIQAHRAIPTVYGFSQHVVPRAFDWEPHVHVGGYWFLDDGNGWQPSDDLLQFLAGGDKPVYVGFGSMPGRDPQAMVDLIGGALKQAGQRGVVTRGWNKAQPLRYDPQRIHLLDSAPHSWLFERVAAVVHHGGAGTTAAGLRAGRPTMIIPHMSDQPFWGRRVHELGAGVKPVPRHKLTEDNLAAGIKTLVSDSRIQQAAEMLGQCIRSEDGIGQSVALIEHYI